MFVPSAFPSSCKCIKSIQNVQNTGEDNPFYPCSSCVLQVAQMLSSSLFLLLHFCLFLHCIVIQGSEAQSHLIFQDSLTWTDERCFLRPRFFSLSCFVICFGRSNVACWNCFLLWKACRDTHGTVINWLLLISISAEGLRRLTANHCGLLLHKHSSVLQICQLPLSHYAHL